MAIDALTVAAAEANVDARFAILSPPLDVINITGGEILAWFADARGWSLDEDICEWGVRAVANLTPGQTASWPEGFSLAEHLITRLVPDATAISQTDY